MAELILHLFEQVITGLTQVRSLDALDTQIVHQPLPPAMLPENEVKATVCFSGDSFKATVLSAQGFTWMDDSKSPMQQKFGYISTVPGSQLTIRLAETSKMAKSSDPSWGTVVRLGHLKSYEHMGIAQVGCVTGCACAQTQFDGHQLARNSLLHYHSFLVELNSDECLLNITVTNHTHSGEHKVKISSIIVVSTQF